MTSILNLEDCKTAGVHCGVSGRGGLATGGRAQQRGPVRRIGVLAGRDENDPFLKLQRSTLTQALADLGWTDGRNVRMDFRSHGGDGKRIRALAQKLVGLQPDIILAGGVPETRTIP